METARDNAIACTGGDSKTLSGGIATCLIAGSKLSAAGSPLDVVAGYQGTAAFQPSSTSTSEVISPTGTMTTVSSSRFPSMPGQAVNFTASVAAVSPGAGIPGGTVTFSFSSVNPPACTGGDTIYLTAAGTAVCKIAKGLITAPVTITATYAGSSAYVSSVGR